MANAGTTVEVGQAALVNNLKLAVPSPSVTSLVGPGVRRIIIIQGDRKLEHYPSSYMPELSLVGHLRFALKYEPIELGILNATFRAVGPAELEAWVRSEPTGAYARRAWFLYEWLTGKRLDLADAGVMNYVDALDPGFHVTAKGISSRRHKVNDNILGYPGFAPTVRKTPRLIEFQGENVDKEARRIIDGCDPDILARAVNFLYTKETKSSFAIEREVATGRKAERFVAALRTARSFEPTDPDNLVTLQNTIVDPRYAASGFRDFQNFVGETVNGYREDVHLICPRPQDVEDLMHCWAGMTERVVGSTDPVVAAALVAFGFVFIHPFEDGNGRIHRFLIHHVLAKQEFTPHDVLFPVSAAIVRDNRGYSAALETFSNTLPEFVDWQFNADKEMVVKNDTADLYRYFDATPLAEFLYEKVADTVRKDLKDELGFLAVYDRAFTEVREYIDMPNRRASKFVQFCMQNGGKLAKRKRNDFAELTDAEINVLQSLVRNAMDEAAEAPEDEIAIVPKP